MITRITITYGKAKAVKRYRVGDTKQRGKTTYIKQFRMAYDGQGRPIGQLSSRGRTLTEWVVKDGPRDRESPNFRP